MKLVIDIPNTSEWVDANDKHIKPDDGELCIVIHKYGPAEPVIMQYIKKADRFLNVSEGFNMDAQNCMDFWELGVADMNIVSVWKPLSLPAEIDALVKQRIDSWFKEDEEETQDNGE